MFADNIKKYQNYREIIAIEKRAGLSHSVYSIVIRKWKIYKQNKRAYEIGKRAAQGYNIYLTFGSDKTVTKGAEDSYKRYAMAMKHYNQTLCNRNSYIVGYNKSKINII